MMFGVVIALSQQTYSFEKGAKKARKSCCEQKMNSKMGLFISCSIENNQLDMIAIIYVLQIERICCSQGFKRA